MTRYRNDLRVWPFGRETAVCSSCQGTGTDKEKVLAYMLSHVPSDRITLGVQCGACDGRGRVLLLEQKTAS